MNHIKSPGTAKQSAVTGRMPATQMPETKKDIVQVLRYELNYLEQGGYESATKEGELKSPFRGSFTCINYNNPLRPHACNQCPLYEFVPPSARTEDVPCHHIVLGGGETVSTLMQSGSRERLMFALEQWLRATIARLEATKAK